MNTPQKNYVTNTFASPSIKDKTTEISTHCKVQRTCKHEITFPASSPHDFPVYVSYQHPAGNHSQSKISSGCNTPNTVVTLCIVDKFSFIFIFGCIVTGRVPHIHTTKHTPTQVQQQTPATSGGKYLHTRGGGSPTLPLTNQNAHTS